MVKNSYATKEDLKKLERNLKNELKNEVTSLKVEVLGELKKMQENDAAHQFSHMRINDDIHEHNERLKKLEAVKI